MLSTISLTATGLGIGSGGLSATLVALLLGGGLELAGVGNGSDIGLVVGILAGLSIGGWVAGRMALHSARFHGALTGLLLATMIVLLARAGGSPADLLQVVWLFLLSAVIAGTAGWLAGRRSGRTS
jgi:hypothetical protein